MDPENIDIFISYSHDDKEIVAPIAAKLKVAGFRIWIDERIMVGNQYRDDIDKAISKCKIFLLMCSKNSVNSKWVKRETCYADEEEKQIIPVILEHVQYPVGLKATLAGTQRLEIYGKDESVWWPKFLDAIRNAGIAVDFESMRHVGEAHRADEMERLRRETERMLAAMKQQNDASDTAKELEARRREEEKRTAEREAKRKQEERQKEERERKRIKEEKQKMERERFHLADEARGKKKDETRQREDEQNNQNTAGNKKPALIAAGAICALVLIIVIGLMVYSGKDGKEVAKEEVPQSEDVAAIESASSEASVSGECVRNGCPEGMCYIPAGTFKMGCLPGDDCLNDEKFVKQVNITKSFCMDRTEVTRGAYKINGSKVRSLGLTVNRCNLFNPEWLSGLCINKISENQMKETELLLNDFIYKVNNKITESELDLINSINNTQNKQIRLDVYREDKLLVFMVETILDEPSDIVCEDCPVELVTWFNAKDYCVKLGKRLPTEAEWEYAARAGTETRNYWGKTKPSSANDYAWYDENTGHWNPVGQKIANGYGLYDMLGSVKEWVMDCYDDRWYNKMANYDPLNNSENCETRVLRGGSVGTDARNLRIYSRYAELPGYRTYANGFRCAKDI